LIPSSQYGAHDPDSGVPVEMGVECVLVPFDVVGYGTTIVVYTVTWALDRILEL
jgi:hypothetical protein